MIGLVSLGTMVSSLRSHLEDLTSVTLGMLWLLFTTLTFQSMLERGPGIFMNVVWLDSFSMGADLALLGSFLVLAAIFGPNWGIWKLWPWVLLGGLLLNHGTDWLLVYISVEMVSLCSYLLAGSNSINSGTKYFLAGTIASTLLVLGLSFQSATIFFVAIAWKLGLAPLHIWFGSVLDDLTKQMAAGLSTVPKVGLLSALTLFSSWSSTLGLLFASISMVVGSLWPLSMNRLLRIFAWSSIAQLGYVLVSFSYDAPILGLVYFGFYSMLSIILINELCAESSSVNLGVALFNTLLSVSLLFGISGLPPSSLFFGKLDILLSTHSSAIMMLVVASSLISSIYYVQMVSYLSFYSPSLISQA